MDCATPRLRAVNRSDAFGITSKDLARRTIFVGGHSVHPRSWESNFAFETLPPPLRGPPPSTEGGEGCAVTLNVGRGLAPAVCGKSDFTFRKSQRLLRRSLRAEALGFVRSALLHYQNFVSGVALAQDDV